MHVHVFLRFCTFFCVFVSLQLVFTAHILTAPRTNILHIGKFFSLLHAFLAFSKVFSVLHMCFLRIGTFSHFFTRFSAFVSLQLVFIITAPQIFCALATFSHRSTPLQLVFSAHLHVFPSPPVNSEISEIFLSAPRCFSIFKSFVIVSTYVHLFLSLQLVLSAQLHIFLTAPCIICALARFSFCSSEFESISCNFFCTCSYALVHVFLRLRSFSVYLHVLL